MKKILLMLPLLVSTGLASAHYEGSFDYPMGHMYVMNSGFWFFGPIVMILFWMGLIILLVYLFRNIDRRQRGNAKSPVK
jgi:uncharacterized membrane protein